MSITVNMDESEPYQCIIDDLIEWDLNIKSGAGIYFKCKKYGHVEFSICESHTKQDSISWKQVEGIIPENYNSHIVAINTLFMQFADFVRRVRQESISLSFEIVDISYHPVDYRDIGYIYAANRAIMNCFGHPDFKFDKNRIFRY